MEEYVLPKGGVESGEDLLSSTLSKRDDSGPINS